jgi:hypothetical protein
LLIVLFYVLFVCKCVLPPGVNPTAVDKYINIMLQKLALQSCAVGFLFQSRSKDQLSWLRVLVIFLSLSSKVLDNVLRPFLSQYVLRTWPQWRNVRFVVDRREVGLGPDRGRSGHCACYSVITAHWATKYTETASGERITPFQIAVLRPTLEHRLSCALLVIPRESFQCVAKGCATRAAQTIMVMNRKFYRFVLQVLRGLWTSVRPPCVPTDLSCLYLFGTYQVLL